MKQSPIMVASRYLMKCSFLVGLFLFCQNTTSANDFSLSEIIGVSGTVSGTDGLPLIGVSIQIKGTSVGTVTDVEGNYALDVPNTDDVLLFSYTGYMAQEIPVAGQSVINVVLEEDITQLGEVVVIGYGTQSRKLLTSSIASVDAKEIEDLQVTTVEGVLQGKAPGVSVLTGSGQPGEPPTIRIRGGSSINRSNQPLFIIDGVQRSAEDFNPEDIQSVEILKDAAATAIYGARASNGVVLVTTKTGTSGKARFSANYRSSWSTLTSKMDLLNAEDYLRIERVGLTRSFLDENSAFGAGANATGGGNPLNSRITTRLLAAGESVPTGYQSMMDPVTGGTLIFIDTDWQDEVYSTAQIDNLHFSVDGGTEKVTYYLGASYLDQEGIARTTNYKRFSVQSNVGFQVSQKLKINTSLNYTRSTSNEPFSSDIIFGRAGRQAPTVRLNFDDGSLSPGVRENLPNPVYYTNHYLNDESINKINLGTVVEYKILENLTATATGNYFTNQKFRNAFIKSNAFNRSRNASSTLGEQRQTQFEGTLRYFKSFAGNNLSILAGASRLESDFFNFGGSASGGSTDAIQTLNAAPNISSLSTFQAQDLLIGYFGRLSYDFQQKYLLAATVRRDGSSRFGFRNQIGYFPSVSAGWRLSEESFFDVPVVSDLKLRASWGQTGNNDIAPPGQSIVFNLYNAQGVVNPGFQYNGGAAAIATNLANLDLGWETTTQTDIGFDLGLLDDRVTFSFDYYEKITDDLLFSRPLPNTSGFGSITENIGKVQFTGTEFSLYTDNIRAKDFTWTTNFNIAFTQNEVLELPDNDLDKNRIGGVVFEDGFTGTAGIAEGEPLGTIVGYQFVKVYETTAEAQEDGLIDMIANDRTGNNGIDYRQRVGGDVKWLDTNGDNIIDINDQVVLGNAIPNITGGFGNTLNFKGFELYVFLDFALGHHIVNQHRYRMNSNSQGNINGTSDLLRAWSEEGDVTDVPRFVFFDFGNARNFHRPDGGTSGGGWQGASSQYVEKGDYLSLRTVRLSYNLPTSMIERIGFSSVKAYLAGQNLHYFTGYKGYNPEVTQIDSGRYPLFRNMSVGVNVGF